MLLFCAVTVESEHKGNEQTRGCYISQPQYGIGIARLDLHTSNWEKVILPDSIVVVGDKIAWELTFQCG